MITAARLEQLKKMIEDRTLNEFLRTFNIWGLSGNEHLGFVGDSHLTLAREENTDAEGTYVTYEFDGWIEWYEWRADDNHAKTLYTLYLALDADGDQIPGAMLIEQV